MSSVPVSVVIPSYRREGVLLDTVNYLLAMSPAPAEILVIDQTEAHEAKTAESLTVLREARKIRWLTLPRPSITHAMNVGLSQARESVVLFVDDDIEPGPDLLSAHWNAHARGEAEIVCGQVLQPGEQPDSTNGEFRFNSGRRQWVNEAIGCNFSVARKVALDLGGFDENFVHVAYRFEAEFCDRAISAGHRILFEPRASIRHLKAWQGGTRSFGHHLTTIRPSHAVGAYYYLLRARGVQGRGGRIVARLFRSIRTRHHLTHPWWIPGTLLSEFLGLIWAIRLRLEGPRLTTAGTRRNDSV